ncbi:MAG TPA: SMI1/KNR4 family protein [Tepidisphaeraceae bacterium]|nr:SMI1/KNR4 family protein [Tepidisphaeraceae bacterium]
MTQLEAEEIVESIRRRLLAIEDDRSFRFRQTSRADASRFLASRGEFTGCSEAEVTDAEQRWGVRFPLLLRAYLRKVGAAHGCLFAGGRSSFSQFEQLKRGALELMTEAGCTEGLPADAVVFLEHQGVSFFYLRAAGGEDSAIYLVAEWAKAPTVVHDGFQHLLETQIGLAEENHKRAIAMGGSFVQLIKGAIIESTPQLMGGVRPLDVDDDFID